MVEDRRVQTANERKRNLFGRISTMRDDGSIKIIMSERNDGKSFRRQSGWMASQTGVVGTNGQ